MSTDRAGDHGLGDDDDPYRGGERVIGPSPAASDLWASGGNRPNVDRFYFRVVDDTLFVFDDESGMARVLNAAAARLFLCLPDTFADPALIAAEAGLEAEAGWRASLEQWIGFGWAEADAAGRVQLRRSRAGVNATGPEEMPAGSEMLRLTGRCRVRLADLSVEVSLCASGDRPQDPFDELDRRSVTGRVAIDRFLAFLGGMADPDPAAVADATIDLVPGPDGCTIRCGARVFHGLPELLAIGKVQLWLLDLACRAVPPAVLIHAAALATAAGSIILAGVSGAGKSTLSAYLAARGWRFGGDDSVAVGFDGGTAAVIPLPGAISLTAGSLPPLAAVYPRLAELPLCGAGDKLGRYLPVPRDRHLPVRGPENRLRCLVFPRFAAGSPTRVAAISASEALLALMQAEFGIGERVGEAELDLFFDALETLPRYAVVYGDLADMELTLRRLVAEADAAAMSSGLADLAPSPEAAL